MKQNYRGMIETEKQQLVLKRMEAMHQDNIKLH